ncbi:hypothetical protein HK405_015386 [Cladochytrium tenue]|nr:hypothetical protein HK405_015386 [Cladochytrium tenue]
MPLPKATWSSNAPSYAAFAQFTQSFATAGFRAALDPAWSAAAAVRPKVLDVAGGPGTTALSLAESLKDAGVAACDLVVTDYAKGMVEYARDHWVAPAGIDITADFKVVNGMPDGHKCLRECLRVLKPGGRLVLGVWRRTIPIFPSYMAAIKSLADARPEGAPVPVPVAAVDDDEDGPAPSLDLAVSWGKPGFLTGALADAGFPAAGVSERSFECDVALQGSELARLGATLVTNPPISRMVYSNVTPDEIGQEGQLLGERFEAAVRKGRDGIIWEGETVKFRGGEAVFVSATKA